MVRFIVFKINYRRLDIVLDVVVVSCEETKNIYYLSPNFLTLKKGDFVVFETENGLLTGYICKEM